MAAGSSAPELFTAIIGVLLYPKSNPGPSTNCASAAFNMCIIIASSVFFSGFKSLSIRAYGFSRDCFFYALSIIELYIFWELMTPGIIHWTEALILVGTWCIYILILAYNDAFISILAHLFIWIGIKGAEDMLYEKIDSEQQLVELSNLHVSDASDFDKATDVEIEEFDSQQISEILPANIVGGGDGIDSEYEHGHHFEPHSQFILLRPFDWMFSKTISKTDIHSSIKQMSKSFFLCILWLGFLSFLCVDLAEKIGKCMHINEDVMGLTILAIGSSLPDCFSSILAAKQGKGEMAVSNALGSNVFDINICIGFSFLLKSTLNRFDGVAVERTSGFNLFILALFVLLAIFMCIMFYHSLVLDFKIGYILIGSYAIFLSVFCYVLQYH